MRHEPRESRSNIYSIDTLALERRKMMQAWANYLDELRALHRKLAVSIDEPDLLGALKDHLDGAHAAVEGGSDHLANLAAAVHRAARCVRSVLTGASESEPADDESLDKDPDATENRGRRW